MAGRAVLPEANTRIRRCRRFALDAGHTLVTDLYHSLLRRNGGAALKNIFQTGNEQRRGGPL